MSDALKPAIHGRDHCPGGIDPIPCLGGGASIFRALHYNDAVGDDITVGGTTSVDVTYNYWDTSFDSAIFRPETALSGTPVLGTDNVQHVNLLATGLYIISWGLNWTAAHSGVTEMLIDDGDPIFTRSDTVAHGATSAFATPGYLTQTISRVYTLLDPFNSGAWTPSISTDVAQSSGSPKIVNEAWLEIAYFTLN